MRATWRLGRIGGVTVGLHWSWLLFFVVIVWSLGVSFPITFPGVSDLAAWPAAVITAVLFLLSVLGHELAHAWVALARGVPVRGITLFILGGAAEIERDPDRPLDEALITAVGPLSSFVFGVGFGVLALVSQAVPAVYAVSATMALINLSLALFNLVPGFPLDGGRLLRAILWATIHDFVRATRIAARAGQLVGWGMVLLGLIQVAFWHQGFGGLWTAGIGWYLTGMAQASYEQVLLQQALRGLQVGQMMREHFAWVYTGTRVADVWNQYFARTPQPGLPVLNGGQLVGVVTLGQVRALPAARWGDAPVDQVMTPVAQLATVAPRDNAGQLLQVMQRGQVMEVPVVEAGRLVGLVTQDDLFHALRTQSRRPRRGAIATP